MSFDVVKTIRLADFGRAELDQYSDRMGSGQGAIEKDFVISIFVLLLSFHGEFSGMAQRLVLKGGTSIKKVYFPDDMRFSEDLDFNSPKYQTMAALLKGTRKLIDEDLGVTKITEVRQQYKNEKALDFQINYTSLLGQPNHITVNMNLGSTERKPNTMAVRVSPYFGGPEPPLRVMSLDEILSEKIRALLQRTQPRDIYDIWFLTKRKGLRIDKPLVRRKLRRSYEAAPVNKKHAAKHYSAKEVIERMKDISDLAWRQQLSGLVLRNSPPQSRVVMEVSRIIRGFGDISL